MNPDLFIVGAGPVGCVIAERAASVKGWTSLVIDQRGHLGGNCHDFTHASGVRIHKYGPHYFRTGNQRLLDYLSRFTEWIPGDYVVRSCVRGKLFPFPINLTTLENFFGRSFTAAEAEEFLRARREPYVAPENSEELILSRVGRELYEAFYLGYTKKQWDLHPRDLDPGVCGRVPVRLDRDEQYVSEPFKVLPRLGYTAMFGAMLRHPKIELRLGVPFRALRGKVAPRVATVFCGPVDEFFDHRLGRLPWRSLSFEFRVHEQEFVQPCVQINYPGEDVPQTRSVEIKHVTKQKHPHTVVAWETPRADGDPYYPIPSPLARRLYENYRELAVAERKAASPTYFCGRLATYRYLNMDAAMEQALATFEEIARDHESIPGSAGLR
jgi:UDP-galactopyranose mutase